MWLTTLSASVPGSADSISDCTQASTLLAERLAQCAWWRGKPSPSPLWLKRCKRLNWIHVLYGLGTSKTYPLTSCPEPTGSQADTPASPSQWPANDKGPTIRVICGPSSETSSELFDQEESSSRTSEGTYPWVSIKSFETWKKMATAARLDCLQRLKSVHLTEDSESSSLAWTTPTSGDTGRKGKYKQGGTALTAQARMWPTATAGDSRNSARHTTTASASKPGTTLVDAARTWPTPQAGDAKTGYQCRKKGGPRVQKNLETLVRDDPQTWPTPTSRDHKDGLTNNQNVPTNGLLGRAANRDPGSPPGLLNPTWVETLMGLPIGWTDFEPSVTA